MKNSLKYLGLLFFGLLIFTSCDDDDVPEMENEEEVIDQVTLTFTPSTGTAITAVANDPDGDGPEDFDLETIALAPNTTYTLTIGVENTEEGEDIGEEIADEDDEHMFFFAFTDGIFSDPAGNGNADARADAINYVDFDDNNDPVGLSTTWTTSDASMGTFRVILKHQPGVKSSTSTSSDGTSDIDLTFSLSIEE